MGVRGRPDLLPEMKGRVISCFSILILLLVEAVMEGVDVSAAVDAKGVAG